MNIPAVSPVLLLKVDKKNKIGIAIRVYLVSVILILTLITVTAFIVDKYSPFPFWLPIVFSIIFIFTLINCIKYIRQFTTKWKRRAVMLASFFIVYAIRFNVVFINTGMGFEITSFGMWWTALFVFACLLAYIGTSAPNTLALSYNSLASRTSEQRVNKAYVPQSEIDTDIAVKGSSVLFDPSLDIVEQQRYRDALEKRKNDSW